MLKKKKEFAWWKDTKESVRSKLNNLKSLIESEAAPPPSPVEPAITDSLVKLRNYEMGGKWIAAPSVLDTALRSIAAKIDGTPYPQGEYPEGHGRRPEVKEAREKWNKIMRADVAKLLEIFLTENPQYRQETGVGGASHPSSEAGMQPPQQSIFEEELTDPQALQGKLPAKS